jgi:hypothetical protein
MAGKIVFDPAQPFTRYEKRTVGRHIVDAANGKSVQKTHEGV